MSAARAVLRQALRPAYTSGASSSHQTLRSGSVLARRVHQASDTPAEEKPSHKTDPWMLPLDPRNPNLKSADDPSAVPNMSELEKELSMLPPLDRSHEDVETMRARLVYQTRKRGTLETDLILSTFAKEKLGSMNKEELMEFDKLLDEADWDIFYWSVQKKQPPPRWADTPLLKALQQHAKNTGKEVRVMPNLDS